MLLEVNGLFTISPKSFYIVIGFFPPREIVGKTLGVKTDLISSLHDISLSILFCSLVCPGQNKNYYCADGPMQGRPTKLLLFY